MAPSAPSPQTQRSSHSNKRIVSSAGVSNASHPLLQNVSAESVPSETQDGTEHRSPAHHRPRSKISRNPKPTKLLHLPVELLHVIATNLCGSNDILNLARVNKHVNHVTQEALIKKLVIPRNHIKQVLELLIRRPQLCEKVNSVDLGDYGCRHHTECRCLGPPHFDQNTLKVIRKVIAANTGGDIVWDDIRQSQGNSGPVWRKNHAFFLDILVSLCPNIKSVTFELPEARPFDSARPPRPASLPPSKLPNLNIELLPVLPFQGPALRLMQKNLEVLTIAENSRWKGPAKVEVLNHQQDLDWRNMGRHTITLTGFAKLKRLDIPMDLLGLPRTVVFRGPTSNAVTINGMITKDSISEHDLTLEQLFMFAKTIPLTLKYLHLKSCNRYTFALLQRYNEIPLHMLKMRHIELFFTTCPRTSITQCYAADKGKLNYLSILSELAKKGVKITFYTGTKKRLFDMRKELTALSFLSPLEAWRFAQSGRQYSQLNSKASVRRRVSMIDHHLFMKHAHDYCGLMNGTAFSSKCWEDVVFFHGVENTKWDTNILPHKSTVHTFDPSLWVLRPRGKREPKRRLRELLDLSQFDFSLRVEMKSTPAPAEVPFLGATIVIPKTTLSVNKNVPKAAKGPDKYVDVHMLGRQEDDDQYRAKKAHREAGKDLDQRMAVLRLRQDVKRTVQNRTVRYPKGSKFDSAGWSFLDWKFYLLPQGGAPKNTKRPRRRVRA